MKRDQTEALKYFPGGFLIQQLLTPAHQSELLVLIRCPKRVKTVNGPRDGD